MPYKIGLTGNIGCGKSAVGEMLRELGADYADADHLVHALLSAGSPLVPKVVDRFGTDVLAAEGGVDRRALGKIVFADELALRDLEALLHPAVRADLRSRMAETTAPVFVVDAIKLIEGGLYREVDSVWVVTCDPDTQRQRLTGLRGMLPKEAEARIAAQSPQAAKVAHADVVIDNSGSLDATRRQVRSAWGQKVAANISS